MRTAAPQPTYSTKIFSLAVPLTFSFSKSATPNQSTISQKDDSVRRTQSAPATVTPVAPTTKKPVGDKRTVPAIKDIAAPTAKATPQPEPLRKAVKRPAAIITTLSQKRPTHLVPDAAGYSPNSVLTESHVSPCTVSSASLTKPVIDFLTPRSR